MTPVGTRVFPTGVVASTDKLSSELSLIRRTEFDGFNELFQ
jgi:hypothetical protein